MSALKANTQLDFHLEKYIYRNIYLYKSVCVYILDLSCSNGPGYVFPFPFAKPWPLKLAQVKRNMNVSHWHFL